MSFRHISKVLADVMADVESARAADKVAHEFGGGSAPREGCMTEPPMLSAGGGTHASNEVPVYIAPRTGKRAAGAAEDGSRLRTETGKKGRAAKPAPSVTGSTSHTLSGGKEERVASLTTAVRNMDRASPSHDAPRGARSIFLIVDNTRPHFSAPSQSTVQPCKAERLG